jgi:hypothetical protein
MQDTKKDTKLNGMLKGNTVPNKQQNAAEFVAPGGRGVDDYSLEAPGLANLIRAAAEANERTVQSIPIYVTHVMEDHCEKVEKNVAGGIQQMVLMQRKSGRFPGIKGICRPSLGMGIALGFIAAMLISWFWLIPAQVAYQRGSDWAIGEYLATPAGTAVRNHYRNCKAKGCK